MKKARCLKCGFTMMVHLRNGKHSAPASCPACGYDKSQQDLDDHIRNIQRNMKASVKTETPFLPPHREEL